jgi:DNA-binding PadR family transcriptional regulator
MTRLELTILGIVREKPRHAYDIEKVIAEKGIRDYLNIGFSTIYSTLKKCKRTAGLKASINHRNGFLDDASIQLPIQGRQLLVEELKKALSRPQREQLLFETGMSFGEYLS